VKTLETDYLIVGAGAGELAFADTRLSDSSTAAIIDPSVAPTVCAARGRIQAATAGAVANLGRLVALQG
jgi:hypothetical protein